MSTQPAEMYPVDVAEEGPRLEAIIFDVDGTLADTERDGHRLAFNEAFRGAGLTWRWDEELYGRLLAVPGGKERIRHWCEHFLTDPVERERWTREAIRELHGQKTRHYLEILERGLVPLRPGVRTLVNEARSRGVRLGIATTTTPVNVTALLSASLFPAALSWFEVMVAGDEVPAKKPAPDVYLAALDQLGLDADRCLAIEDSEKGLAAATAAGIRTVVTVNEYTRRQDFAAAALVLDSLEDFDLDQAEELLKSA